MSVAWQGQSSQGTVSCLHLGLDRLLALAYFPLLLACVHTFPRIVIYKLGLAKATRKGWGCCLIVLEECRHKADSISSIHSSMPCGLVLIQLRRNLDKMPKCNSMCIHRSTRSLTPWFEIIEKLVRPLLDSYDLLGEVTRCKVVGTSPGQLRVVLRLPFQQRRFSGDFRSLDF